MDIIDKCPICGQDLFIESKVVRIWLLLRYRQGYAIDVVRLSLIVRPQNR